MGAVAGLLTFTALYIAARLLQLPPLVPAGVWITFSVIMGALAARNGPRSNSIAVAIGVLLGGGLAAGAHALAPAAAIQASSASPNRALKLQVLELRRQLVIHAGRSRQPDAPAYPSASQFPTFVRGLPGGDALLVNPFDGRPRTGVATVTPPLKSAAELTNGAMPPALGTPLQAPLPSGSLVYDYDASDDTYVLYGIGEENTRTVLVAMARGGR